MRAIEATEYGDAGVLKTVDNEKPEPDHGEIRIEVAAAGINFADIMQRRGKYHGGPDAPFVPGLEAAGKVDAVGEGAGLEEGDRVVAMLQDGGYAEYATAPTHSVFPVPDAMNFEEAAGFPVQFLTAHGCLFGWGGLEEAERVLIHAAAGGVGTAAVQLASQAGAEVFGTASTAAKLDLAERLGCDHPINYTEESFAEVVDKKTDGEGVDLVLDGVGGDVFHDSLDAVSHFGRIVTYGVASGEPPAVETPELLFRNVQVIGYHLGQAVYRNPGKALEGVPELTEGLTSGDLEVILGKQFDLEDAADAHQYIEDRKSSGKVLLTP